MTLKMARRQRNLTQKQLADKIDCSRSTISRWENGHSTPLRRTRNRIRRILDEENIDYDVQPIKITGWFSRQLELAI
jgi:transcriptional regulator with XRE-family HTH domain